MFNLTHDIPSTGFYVYVLINPTNNLPFYVGKGKGPRCLHHVREAITRNVVKTQNKHKINTIRKIVRDGSRVGIDIVFVSDDEEDCMLKEKELIRQYGRRDNQTGVLTNLTDGGDGASGYTHTEEYKTQRSRQSSGSNNGMFGKNHHDESRKQISRTRLERLAKGDIIPTKHTEEHKRRLREHNPGGKATARAVHQIDTSGSIVATWPSTKAAGAALQWKSFRNISTVANKKKQQTARGFYWRWVGDPDVVNGKLITIDQLEKARSDLALRAGRPIEQLTLSGQRIQTWKNMCEAARVLDIDNSAISAAIKSNRPYAGFIWAKV